MKKQNWTNKELEILKKEYSNSTNILIVAKILNRPISSVYTKANRLGLKYIRRPFEKSNPNWKGGKPLMHQGYYLLFSKRDCPYSVKGTVKRCVYVWWRHYPNNKILNGEIIHHKNGNKLDDRIKNLEKMTISEHARLHIKTRRRKKNGRL